MRRRILGEVVCLVVDQVEVEKTPVVDGGGTNIWTVILSWLSPGTLTLIAEKELPRREKITPACSLKAEAVPTVFSITEDS